MSTNKKIVLGFSGGMDSAYAALLLKDKGYDVVAVNLLMHDNCNYTEAAKYTADKMGLDFVPFDARVPFEAKVIKPFVSSYVRGITPNPCIACNPLVKFKYLFHVANELGIEHVATGHYAKKVLSSNGSFTFAAATDASKDQAYFLYRLPQEYLANLIFPLENTKKNDIKNFFEAHPEYLFASKESYDVCFVADREYSDIVAEYSELPPSGSIIDVDGNILGKHNGIHNYTVGQRKGLGVALGRPAFVTSIDADENTVTLSYPETAYIKQFDVYDCNFMSKESVFLGERFAVKIRYRAKPVMCTVCDVDKNIITVEFDDMQMPVAKGQSAVFYDENELIVFGGIIR